MTLTLGGAILGGTGFLVFGFLSFSDFLEAGPLTYIVPPRRALPCTWLNSGLLPPECGLILCVLSFWFIFVGFVFAFPYAKNAGFPK